MKFEKQRQVIFEREGKNIYQREIGSDPDSRVLILVLDGKSRYHFCEGGTTTKNHK